MKTADFHYDLPPEAVAQEPAEPRDSARLLRLDRRAGPPPAPCFRDLPALLAPGDLLVFNDTRVLPWRLVGSRPTGGRVECLILGLAGAQGEGFFRPSRRLRVGDLLSMEGGVLELLLAARRGQGKWTFTLRAPSGADPAELLDAVGRPPLPPYIRRADQDPRTPRDRERYQTVYASRPGAVAAPTAGLHFTPALLAALEEAGIASTRLTLHVGPGTFLPVTAGRVEDHRMHSEWLEVPPAAAQAVADARARGGRVVAVGTTSVRALESRAAGDGRVEPGSGWTEIFIHPGYNFRVVDALVTNFHLPESTLLMLVAAFAGRERVLECYAQAVRRGYRFYSYGDAMLVG